MAKIMAHQRQEVHEHEDELWGHVNKRTIRRNVARSLKVYSNACIIHFVASRNIRTAGPFFSHDPSYVTM